MSAEPSTRMASMLGGFLVLDKPFSRQGSGRLFSQVEEVHFLRVKVEFPYFYIQTAVREFHLLTSAIYVVLG